MNTADGRENITFGSTSIRAALSTQLRQLEVARERASEQAEIALEQWGANYRRERELEQAQEVQLRLEQERAEEQRRL
jgi:hypothetical protein